MKSQSQLSRFAPLILIAGDLLVLLLFIFAGQREHDLTDPVHPILGVLLTTGEFAVAWLVAGWLLGAFPKMGGEPEDRPYGVRSLLGRSLNAWLVAAPQGVLIRAFFLKRAVIPTVFLGVTLGLGGMFLLGWRLVFALAWGRVVQQRIRETNG
ncbi:MAG: DUF3054 domain-containing protein [Chloroflexi bacterium]|nr:DUF3054 domain-containing protein [Chloroflexota bacterium]